MPTWRSMRQSAADETGRWQPDRGSVVRRDEVRGTAGVYTANGAYLSWEEKSKGALEPGKLADMIVLPFDPLTASPETILAGQVD